MSEEPLTLDLRDKNNPPPDDPVKAPHGWWWNNKTTYLRGTGWYPRKTPAGTHGSKKDTSPEVEEQVQEVLEDRGFSDPAPAYATPQPRKTKARKLPPPKVNARIRGDMSAAVGMFVMAAGPAVMARDPYCGSAFLGNAQEITDAVIPLMCRSHTIVAFFSDSSENGWLLWFKLAIALAPVGQAVAQHHILRTVEIVADPETGQPIVRPRDLSEFSTEETADAAAG